MKLLFWRDRGEEERPPKPDAETESKVASYGLEEVTFKYQSGADEVIEAIQLRERENGYEIGVAEFDFDKRGCSNPRIFIPYEVLAERPRREEMGTVELNWEVRYEYEWKDHPDWSRWSSEWKRRPKELVSSEVKWP